MHYIPGTRLIPSGNTGRQHNTISQFKSAKKKVGPFLVGKEYELWCIRKTPQETYKYTFKDLSSSNREEMIFDTMIQADEFIARVRGEDLPNYNNIDN